MQDNPCRKCVPPKRSPGCHDRCPDRDKWLEKQEVIKANRRKEQEEEAAIIDYRQGASKRMRWYR